MPIVWLNGELMDASRARVPALDRGLVWGYGLFETLRAYGGRVWALDEHYRRLEAGAGVLDMPIPTSEVVRDALEAVLAANGGGDAGVRITVTRGEGPPDPHSPAMGPPNVLATAWALRDYSSLYEGGVTLATLHGGGRPLAGVKSTSYALSVAGRVAAARAGADDALFVDGDGRVLEATGANVMAVFGTTLVSPPAEAGVLPGVTRRTVLGVAPSVGLVPVEEGLRVTDLYRADEVVLTSTLREVYPVRSVDGRDVHRQDAAARLRAAFRSEVRRRLEAEERR